MQIRIFHEHRDAWFRSIRYDATLFSIVDLAQNTTFALILWVGAGLWHGSVVPLAPLIVFIDLMRRFSGR